MYVCMYMFYKHYIHYYHGETMHVTLSRRISVFLSKHRYSVKLSYNQLEKKYSVYIVITKYIH